MLVRLLLFASLVALALVPFAHRPVSAQTLGQQQALVALGLSYVDLCRDSRQGDDTTGDRTCPACHLVKSMGMPPAPTLWSAATHHARLVWHDASRPHAIGHLSRAPPARAPPSST